MTATISISGLDAPLGGSVIYDEYKGDLSEARQAAEQQLSAARQSQEPAQLADALLARAVVHLLQGEPADVLACCDEIVSVADPPRQFRAAVYATLAAYQRWNTFPSGATADGAEFELRQAEFMAALAAHSQRRSQLQPQIAEPALLLENSLVAGFLPGMLHARAFLAGVRGMTVDRAAQFTSMALQTPQTFLQQTVGLEIAPSLRAYADLEAADLHWRAGDAPRAEQLLAQAAATYASAGDQAGQALCRMRWADWRAAPFSMPLALNLAITSSTVEGSQLSSAIEAQEFSRAGRDLAAAQRAYAEAETLFRAAQAPRGLAAIQLRRGYLAFLVDDAAGALAAAEQAAAQFAAGGDWLGFWLARTHTLLLRIAAGLLPEDQAAAAAIGAWGARAGSFSYALGLGLLCSRIGRHWLLRRGDYERALACFRLAAALNQALGATTHHAQNLVDQGAVLHSIGERVGALTLYEQAIERYTHEIERAPLLAESLRQRAIMLSSSLYQLSDQAMDADGMERSAARLERLIAPLGGLAGSLVDMASAVLRGGQDGAFERSLTLVEAQYARELTKAAGVLIPSYRARAARDRGDSAEAQRLFALAEDAVRQIDDGQRGFLEGVLLSHQRRYAEAAVVLRRYFAADRDAGGGLAQTLAAWTQGQAEAQLAQRRRHDQAASAFVRVKEYAEARAHFAALEQIGGAEWWRDQERPWETLSDYGEMYEGLGQLPQALAAYEQAITLLEQRRQQLSRDELKTALAAGRSPQYLYFYAARAAQKWQAQLFQAGERAQAGAVVARAFAYAERGKARALLDLMAGSAALARMPRGESGALRGWREQTARLTLWRGLLAREHGQREPDAERIDALSQQIAAGEAELHQIERELARTDPNFYRVLDPETSVLAIDAVCAALPAQTALLSYYALGEELLLWAITREGVALAYLVSLDVKALERDLRAFHLACEQQQPLDATGAALSQALLAPAAAALHDNARLIITPHGAAHALPFHALPWQGQPLGVTHTISYLPNASALQFLRPDAPINATHVLAVGNPANMSFEPPLGVRVSAPSLPAAAAEAATVAALFPEHTLLLDAQATEAAVRAEIERYPLLHFATHGYLSEDAPLLSAILFADGDALSVYEIMSLQLDADLVTLSACRTALGATTGGDDVLGLTRGLLSAGARAALVSLWPVNDASTSLLMSRFYRHLRAGATPAAALQAAQNELRSLSAAEIRRELSLLDQPPTDTRDVRIAGAAPAAAQNYSHPFYWAPFILIG
jgi:CHAT domain-containing protein